MVETLTRCSVIPSAHRSNWGKKILYSQFSHCKILTYIRWPTRPNFESKPTFSCSLFFTGIFVLCVRFTGGKEQNYTKKKLNKMSIRRKMQNSLDSNHNPIDVPLWFRISMAMSPQVSFDFLYFFILSKTLSSKFFQVFLFLQLNLFGYWGFRSHSLREQCPLQG